MKLAPPSLMSCYAEARNGTQVLGQGTAFLVRHQGQGWLVTNWHVAAGRNPFTGTALHSSLATPDHLVIKAPVPTSGDVAFTDVKVPLLDRDGYPLWLEHPSYARHVDAVAIPMETPPATYAWTTLGRGTPTLLPYDLLDKSTPEGLLAGVAQSVSIIGFPFGRTGGLQALPIWVNGSVATELDVDFDDRPCFLIDSRTRTGQSGSPVIVYSGGGGAALAGGGTGFFTGPVWRLLGVYSGRINDSSDLGFVWKSRAILEIVTAGLSGNGDMIGPQQPPRTES